jgi:hypothetical protein
VSLEHVLTVKNVGVKKFVRDEGKLKPLRKFIVTDKLDESDRIDDSACSPGE